MGERIRLHNWAATPLGALTDWPMPLRLAVSLCVKSQSPIVINWGWPDLIVLYNDAFIPLTGEKHPAALGTRLFESWPELRSTVEATLESVLTAGKAALSEDLLHVYNRNGFLEERYYTVSFNPIVLESGRTGGCFSFTNNTTDRVIGERRLRTLRDLAARSADARETEEACRIAADVISGNSHDIPFALYAPEENRKLARLVGSVGPEPGSTASPRTIELQITETCKTWPLARVAATNQPVQVNNLGERFGPLPGGHGTIRLNPLWYSRSLRPAPTWWMRSWWRGSVLVERSTMRIERSLTRSPPRSAPPSCALGCERKYHSSRRTPSYRIGKEAFRKRSLRWLSDSDLLRWSAIADAGCIRLSNLKACDQPAM